MPPQRLSGHRHQTHVGKEILLAKQGQKLPKAGQNAGMVCDAVAQEPIAHRAKPGLAQIERIQRRAGNQGAEEQVQPKSFGKADTVAAADQRVPEVAGHRRPVVAERADYAFRVAGRA